MDRRIQKTKLAIRMAFFHLMLENPTGKITVAQIARTANIDRKTFYIHYDSVDDIFDEFSNEKIRELEALLRTEGFYDQPFNPMAILTAMNHLLMEDLPFYRKLASSINTTRFWETVQSILVQTIVNVYRDIAVVTPYQLELHAHYFASGILTIYLRWLQNDEGMTLEELGHYAGEIAAYGLVQMFPQLERESQAAESSVQA